MIKTPVNEPRGKKKKEESLSSNFQELISYAFQLSSFALLSRAKGQEATCECSVVSDSLRPYGLSPIRLLCPWDFPGKNTGVGCPFLLLGIFPTQGSSLRLLHCRKILYCWAIGEAQQEAIGNVNVSLKRKVSRFAGGFSRLPAAWFSASGSL